jgi:hypothetical protein
MPTLVTLIDSAATVTVLRCHDCGAAWLQSDEFITQCIRCQSINLGETDAVLDPRDNQTYIAVASAAGDSIQ